MPSNSGAAPLSRTSVRHWRCQCLISALAFFRFLFRAPFLYFSTSVDAFINTFPSTQTMDAHAPDRRQYDGVQQSDDSTMLASLAL